MSTWLICFNDNNRNRESQLEQSLPIHPSAGYWHQENIIKSMCMVWIFTTVHSIHLIYSHARNLFTSSFLMHEKQSFFCVLFSMKSIDFFFVRTIGYWKHKFSCLSHKKKVAFETFDRAFSVSFIWGYIYSMSSLTINICQAGCFCYINFTLRYILNNAFLGW